VLIGYVRVSKSDGTQTLEPQRDVLLAAGVAPERIYQDLASGRSDARPGLAACLKALQPGNTLVLRKLDRLGRDLRHLVNTVEDLRVRGVGLKVLAGAGAQIDTTTANGRLAFGHRQGNERLAQRDAVRQDRGWGYDARARHAINEADRLSLYVSRLTRWRS
jgi:DNA invertase Pin-like site-specific DNA recombinase